MIYIDPVTRQRVSYMPGTIDLQYDLIGDKSISEETVPVIGPWSDYTGSSDINSRAQQMNYGRSNLLFGTDPGMEGHTVPNIGIVGQNTQTTRRRRIRRRVTL